MHAADLINRRAARVATHVALAFIAAALGLVYAGLIVMLFALPARAGELAQEQAAVLYAIAYSHVGGNLPDKPPTIRLVDRATLQAIACNGANCPVRGYQRGADVFVDAALDFADPRDAAVLLHEIVHFLQFARAGPAQDCHEWLRREREAYLIQARELERLGHDTLNVLRIARSVGCG
jgi:hypothetical protein